MSLKLSWSLSIAYLAVLVSKGLPLVLHSVASVVRAEQSPLLIVVRLGTPNALVVSGGA